MIDLILLGTGAMVPLPHRWLSSLLIRVDGSLVLFDCGEGTQIAFREHHWGFKRLDVICFTHMHADHVAGLPGLLHTVANAGRTETMHIYGPVGTITVVQGLLVIAQGLPFDIVIQELAEGEQIELPGGANARVAYGSHRIPVIGYRVERPRDPAFDRGRAVSLGVPVELWSALQRGDPVVLAGREIHPRDVHGPPRKGVSFGFVTDTVPVSGLRELAAGVDLLICEGTYGDDDYADKAAAWGHMTFGQAATLARDAGVGNLWLTHFSSGMLDPESYLTNATAIFPQTTIGLEGLTGQLIFKDGYRLVAPGSANRSLVTARESDQVVQRRDRGQG